ncbi:MAG: flagellar biosynthesis protein FlhA [Pseudomonadota bacterium]
MRKDIALILLILAILALIVVPLGPTMLDILLSVNLTLSVLLLIVAVYLKHPADFPTFPTVILLGTAFRLALSISTTRQILSEAEAGEIIETFGTFVIGGNIAIGLIVFLIITVFQFLVVTKGAERVAEVSARFALDALPGKQMSIDADLRAEAIDKQTAQERREALARESQFFGAMDGAMKFVKGDAIAGLIIIFINLIGGISVGMLVLGFTFEDAVATYTLLTLGDGLVAQLPALLMALCAGIVTTRVDSTENIDLGSDIWRDLASDPRVPAAAAGIVVLIGLVPGFPFVNFAVGAGVLLFVSFSMRQVIAAQDRKLAEAPPLAEDPMQEAEEESAPAPAINEGVRSDRIVLRIGDELASELNLMQLDTTVQSFLARYDQTRGLAFDPPFIDITTRSGRHGRLFEVVLDEVPVASETIPENSLLLRCDASLLDALGCDPDDVKRVRWHEFDGYFAPREVWQGAVDAQLTPILVEEHIATVVFRVFETNVGVLFSEDHFNRFLEQLARTSPRQQAQLEAQSDRTIFFQTLRYLAEDGVPLRPVPFIVDTYLTWVQTHGNVGALELSEYMRGSLKRQICHAMVGSRDMLGVVLLDPAIESYARNAVIETEGADSPAGSDGLPLAPHISEGLLGQFRKLISGLSADDPFPVVIASSNIRRRLRNYLSANRIALPVMAPHELSPEVNVHPIARFRMPDMDEAY